VAISPDGKTGYWGFTDTALILDLEKATIKTNVGVSATRILPYFERLALSPDGKWLFLVDTGSKNLLVLDTQRNSLLKALPLEIGNTSDCLNLSADGKVYMTLKGGGLAVVSVSDLSYQQIPPPQNRVFLNVFPSALRPGLLYCIGGSGPQKFFFSYNVRTNAIEKQVTFSAVKVDRLLVSPSEDAAFLGYAYSRGSAPGVGDLIAVDLVTFHLTSLPIEGGVADLFFHEGNGRLYIVGCSTGYILEWDPATRSVTRRIPVVPSGEMLTVLIDPANPRYLYQAQRQLIRKVDIPAGIEVMRIKFDQPRLMPSMLRDGDGMAYLTCLRSPNVYRLDLSSGELKGTIPLPDGLPGMAEKGAYHNGSLYLATSTTIYTVNPSNGEVQSRHLLEPRRNLGRFAFFRDKMAAIDYSPGRPLDLLLFDAATMKVVKSLVSG
jgi:DNA-binding beta-propeller fold protein YncE